MIAIHAVRMNGGSGHAHIAAVRWRNPDTDQTGESTTADVVRWLEAEPETNRAYVCGRGGHLARVGIVNAKPPYLRAFADDVWTDNLLALPRF